VRRARSRPALAESLRRERLVLVSSWKLPAALAGEEPELSLQDHAALNEQLAQLVSRGVPLVDALEICRTVVREDSAPRVERLRDMVRGGKGFSDACRAVGSFDRVTTAVYAAAEKTGDLAGACRQLAVTARRQLAVRGKAATLLIYPAIVLSISVCVGLAMLLFIVPLIGKSLERTGRELPVITRVMMDLGLFLRANWLGALVVVGGVVGALVVFRAALVPVASSIMRRLPGVKDVVLAQEWARFFTVLSAMTRAGIPLGDALGVGVQAIGHPAIRDDLSRLRVKLIEGGVFRTLLDSVASLAPATRKLLAAADQAGDLDTAFDQLAGDYLEQVDQKTSRLMALLEPALTVAMFLIIGSMIMAIMAPLITATTSGL
jgi:general secretion pathway protein F